MSQYVPQRFKPSPRRMPVHANVRAEVWERDRGICRYCDFPGEVLDHVVPYRYSRSNEPDNLVVACARCNGLGGRHVFASLEEKRDFILAKRRTDFLAQ